MIVGDSGTGYTSSYHGIYRFMDLALRLSKPIQEPDGTTGIRRLLELRLPFTGDEPRNLVPVDWVARAIVQLVSHPETHGRTYHLVSPNPTSSRLIQAVAASVLHLEGVRFAGSESIADRSPLERLFFDHLTEYAPYHRGDPSFDCRHLSAALPNLPAPRVDRDLLRRLVSFAVADRWGRGQRATVHSAASESRLDCRRYIEESFPKAARQSSLARSIGLEAVVGLDVRGPAGGQWTLTWIGGELIDVRRGLSENADAIYRLDATTFDRVIRGKQTPQQAFFAQRIEIEGNVEKGLKLAVLLEHFLAEAPVESPVSQEEPDALPQLA